ncbi:sensor histidine kinase [Gulosibacter sp. 10]|uniref:sensor histidine kinase n=1 Tax=Gulosibacter sp. 10 TaxID=1255570 RepID=UPI00097F3678|nr:sensor histidine kinase [Gulosibacter sp. 10]SJM59194.1 Putative two-component system sensor kinase [Gulosibacter sp. 10]
MPNSTPSPHAAPGAQPAPPQDPQRQDSQQHPQRQGPFRRMLANLGRDYALVMPGFFLALFSFVVLVPMLALSLGTFVIWVGALLLPVTLIVATWFAQLSRVRLRRWGAAIPAPRYREPGRGAMGVLRLMGDGRRWLDLAFETIVALPLRTATFCVALTWTAMVPGGLLYFVWGRFLPDGGSDVEFLLTWLSGGAFPAEVSGSFAFQSAVYLVIGLVFLATLPAVMRGLALLEASVGTAALIGSPRAVPEGTAPEKPAPGEAVPGYAAPESAAREDAAPEDRPVGPAPRSSSLTGSLDGWLWLIAGFAAVAGISVSWPILGAAYGVHPAIAMALALAQAGALLLAPRLPFPAVALGLVAAFSTAMFSAPATGQPWPWPVPTMIMLFVLVLLLSLRHPPAAAAFVGVLVAVVSAAAILLTGAGWTGAVANSVIVLSVAVALALIGMFLRQLSLSRSELQRERSTRRQQDAKQRELEERNRIARELHDVVAHSMSVISVQATTAPYRRPGLAPEVAEEFATIADSSRRALHEMRGLLSILRGSDDAELAPQPEFADIPALVELTRNSGAEVSLVVEPAGAAEAARIAPTVGLAAYRTVQEALSNAVRHSPGADIAVRIAVDDEAVGIRVENGAPDPASGVTAAPGAGLGLSGVRERVAALGGSVAAHPLPRGGYLLEARVPRD